MLYGPFQVSLPICQFSDSRQNLIHDLNLKSIYKLRILIKQKAIDNPKKTKKMYLENMISNNMDSSNQLLLGELAVPS